MKKEIGQLHKQTCFAPRSVKEMTRDEIRKAVEALMFLTEKCDGLIKGRQVYNGKPTREWLMRPDSASPTVAMESITLLAMNDCNVGCDVESYDIPNAYIQMPMPMGLNNK